MFGSFYKSRKWALWAYGGGALLIAITWIQVQFTVLFNEWYGRFYDLLQRSDQYGDNPEKGLTEFYDQIFSPSFLTDGFEGAPSFLLLAMPSIVLGMFMRWFTKIYVLRWREAMTFSYIPRWRAVKEEIEGASQRIQEDCFRFARIVEDLSLQVVEAFLTLIAFIPILWALSEQVDLPILKDYEGSLVWVALIVSIGGLAISWVVGAKLPGLEYNNQKVEAAFRKDLVLGEDNKEKYAQPNRLWELFLGIRFNYHRLYLHYSYFNLWWLSYRQVMIILPLFIMGPGLFSGVVSLGVVMRVNQAFGEVHGAFSVFMNNWIYITELRSIRKRLKEFENNLTRYSNSNTDLGYQPAD
ncbi:putative transporter [Aestuariispira insulae]|uniref:Peptide/bleomycin uptake transporter n=1 Tax=Aestuariispira insulae TaxID=1461337 RepID=A0A3D9H2Q0_9PROT|nr:putative transporter [Aestuariispira insulae]RED43752.1 peptide/bleomycin uptake transporter [Aestuariispira insulae]